MEHQPSHPSDKAYDIMLIDAPIEVPGNASRYFPDRSSAQGQPQALLGLALSSGDHIFNPLHQPDLIRYDQNYFTTSCELTGGGWLPTLHHLPQVLSHWGASRPSICDIGCGQGELVRALRADGLVASGFDPALREPSSHLHAELWSPSHPDGDADLLVMRCVLPHIQQPWDFLAGLATRRRHVLIEYQRIEWLIENGIWYGLHHDHVNYFVFEDFDRHSVVVDRGTFADGEWAWVLLELDPDTPSAAPRSSIAPLASVSPLTGSMKESIEELRSKRLSTASEFRSSGRPVVVWGAAGKGVVASDALARLDAPVLAAVDADPDKCGLFLECSGVEVWSPERLRQTLSTGNETVVCVANPRHVPDVKHFLETDPHLLVRGLGTPRTSRKPDGATLTRPR